MPDQPKPRARALFSDPNREPVKVVDLVSFHPLRGGTFDITFCVLVPAVVGDDQTVREPVVTARLRLDLGMAKAVIDGLSQQVAMAEATVSTKN